MLPYHAASIFNQIPRANNSNKTPTKLPAKCDNSMTGKGTTSFIDLTTSGLVGSDPETNNKAPANNNKKEYNCGTIADKTF